VTAQPDLEPYRPELLAHLYRMLGSVHDAEDAVQETLLRAWRGLDRFDGRSSLRGWLYRIATNVALTAIERRGRQPVPSDEDVIEPLPDDALGPAATAEQRERVELAFVAALQHLPPNQRAALLLRDVLGLSAAEVAEAMETSVAAVNSALQHARAGIEGRVPPESQQETLRALGDEGVRALVGRYTAALQAGDVEAMVALLADDVTWSMPPLAECYSGLEAVRGFLARGPMTRRWRHLPARANGQVAVGCYMLDETGEYRAYALDVLDLRGDRVAAVTAFLDGSLFAAVGLPPVMSP
jgi:RNA polymerase sigma-70 factor, ECF subfamily